MRRLIQILVLASITELCVAGTFQDDKIYTVSEVSVKPQPVKGLDDFQKRWSKEGDYPEKALEEQIQGVVDRRRDKACLVSTLQSFQTTHRSP